MVRALASVLLLGMIPHAGLQEFVYSLPDIDVVPIASPRVFASKLALPDITASGAVLMDLESGQALYEKEADTPLPMASLTKMMTALILSEHHALAETVAIPDGAAAQDGSVIGLTTGQRFTLHDLMLALLLPSANDVAYSLAVHHAGSSAKFVDEMNARAEVLGLQDTHFKNPAGFDDAEQYASPRNLAWLASAFLKKPELKAMVRRRYATIYSSDGTRFDLTNTNELLHSERNIYGVKTGTTNDAGQCLVTMFVHNKKAYLLVLLHSKQRYKDTMSVVNALAETPTIP